MLIYHVGLKLPTKKNWPFPLFSTEKSQLSFKYTIVYYVPLMHIKKKKKKENVFKSSDFKYKSNGVGINMGL